MYRYLSLTSQWLNQYDLEIRNGAISFAHSSHISIVLRVSVRMSPLIYTRTGYRVRWWDPVALIFSMFYVLHKLYWSRLSCRHQFQQCEHIVGTQDILSGLVEDSHANFSKDSSVGYDIIYNLVQLLLAKIRTQIFQRTVASNAM